MSSKPDRKGESQGEVIPERVKEELERFTNPAIFPSLIQPSALPLIALATYTAYAGETKPVNSQEFFRDVQKIATVESLNVPSKSPLVPVSTEVELTLPNEAVAVLQGLNTLLEAHKTAPLQLTRLTPRGRKWKVKLPWSYSAETQVLMLLQLDKIEVMHSKASAEAGEEPARRVKRTGTISLHYGLAEGLTTHRYLLSEPDVQERANALWDALTIGFGGNLPEEEIPSALDENGFHLLYLPYSRGVAGMLLPSSQYLITSLFLWIRKNALGESNDTTNQLSGWFEELYSERLERYLHAYRRQAGNKDRQEVKARLQGLLLTEGENFGIQLNQQRAPEDLNE